VAEQVSTATCSSIWLDGAVDEAELDHLGSMRGTTWSAPTLALTSVICSLVGGKAALHWSQRVVQSACKAGRARWMGLATRSG
jgi:hypothetical protein